MPVPTYYTVASGSGSNTSWTVTMPSGLSEGDTIVILLCQRGAATLSTTPADAGYTSHGSSANSTSIKTWIYSKTAGASESSVSVVSPNNDRYAWHAIRISGSVYDTRAATTGSTTTLVTPTATAANANTLAIRYNGTLGATGQTITDYTPAGTLIGRVKSSTGSNDIAFVVGYTEHASAGAVGAENGSSPAAGAYSGVTALYYSAVNDPAITAVGRIQSGHAFTITGTDFGASKGTNGRVILSPTDNSADAGAVVQTVVDAGDWSATSITIDSATTTGFSAGDTVYVFVRNDSSDENAAGFATAIADPTLRVNRTLKDTDSGAAITQDPLEVVVLTGAAGSRTVELNVTTEASAAGLVEIDNALYTIANLNDSKLVVMRQSDTRMGLDFATVVDRNDG